MDKLRLNLHIAGPQGSGKGTQADILSKKLDLINISSGQLLRDRTAKKDEFGQILKNILDNGEMIPIGIHARIIEETIKKSPETRGFIFDGVIRSEAQLELFNQLWGKLELDKPLYIVLEISDAESVLRIEKRRTCTKCGYIAIANPNEIQLSCPRCGEVMVQRSDDTKEAILKRLNIYHKETKPLIKHFQKLNRAIVIDGSPSIPQVTTLILEELKKKNIF